MTSLDLTKYPRAPRKRTDIRRSGRGYVGDSAKRPPRIGRTQEKVLLLLLGGLTLGLARSSKQYFRVVRGLKEEWRAIERRALNDAIRALYASKLVTVKENSNGTTTLILSKDGKKLALTYDLDNLAIPIPARWDGKWRIVMFDVPSRMKQLRETLRYHFRQMGFYQFQKSVFVHPHPCASEIEYIMEFYGARRYVRFVTAIEVDNALALKRHFDLA